MVRPPQRGTANLIHGAMGRGKHGALKMAVEVEGQDEPVDCVVKLDALQYVPPLEHLREWLGAAIGRHIGIAVPEPFEVLVAPELAATAEVPALRSALKAAVRPVFGSGLVVGAVPVQPDETLPVEVRAAAAELLAFDVLIHNSDRRASNPNTFQRRGQVIAFDHGDAFAFLLPLLGGSDPVKSALLDEVVRGHVFARSFGPRSGVSLNRIRDAIADLDDEFFDALEQVTPRAWTDRLAAGRLEQACSVIRRRCRAVDSWLPQVETWILK